MFYQASQFQKNVKSVPMIPNATEVNASAQQNAHLNMNLYVELMEER